MKSYLPSQRSLMKFTRDLAAALVVFIGAYIANNYQNLNLDPAVVAIATPIALLAYRTARGYLQGDPTD